MPENLATTGLPPKRYSLLPNDVNPITPANKSDAIRKHQKTSGRPKNMDFPNSANMGSISPTLLPPVTAIPIP